MKKIRDTLVNELRKYFEQNGFTRAVVGISGGVDSAVTTAISVHALGKENVFGLILPHSDFSSSENMDDAQQLAKTLDIPFEIVQINTFAKPFLDLPWVQDTLTRANILARTRMVMLYSWANEHGCLVLGTCNKSETLLGYETKFGDGACDISVLGDLWKTEVWELARDLELPEKFITKAPSAELFEGHSDEQELGYDYHFADTILQKWEKGEKLDTSDPKISDILRRIREHEHKRKYPPIIFKNKK